MQKADEDEDEDEDEEEEEEPHSGKLMCHRKGRKYVSSRNGNQKDFTVNGTNLPFGHNWKTLQHLKN